MIVRRATLVRRITTGDPIRLMGAPRREVGRPSAVPRLAEVGSVPAGARRRAEPRTFNLSIFSMPDPIQLRDLSSRDLDALTDLLADAVEQGASVGYVLPVDRALLHAYWRDVASEVAAGSIALFVIRGAAPDSILASAQLALCGKPNGLHRAEVQKVLVHSSARRKGYGAALMRALEAHATRVGRSLLVLDTESESAGERLYESAGYARAGQIPQFAMGNSGGFVATTYMYKILEGRA